MAGEEPIRGADHGNRDEAADPTGWAGLFELRAAPLTETDPFPVLKLAPGTLHAGSSEG